MRRWNVWVVSASLVACGGSASVDRAPAETGCMDGALDGPIGSDSDGLDETLEASVSSGALHFTLAPCGGAIGYDYAAAFDGGGGYGGPEGALSLGDADGGAFVNVAIQLLDRPSTGSYASTEAGARGGVTVAMMAPGVSELLEAGGTTGSWTLTITSVTLAAAQGPTPGNTRYAFHGALDATLVGTTNAATPVSGTLHVTF